MLTFRGQRLGVRAFAEGQYGTGRYSATPAGCRPSTRTAALLSRRHCDVFCLNDTDSTDVLLSEQQAMLADFLSAYFPFRAPFEVPAEVEAQRAGRSASALAAELLPEPPKVAAPRRGGVGAGVGAGDRAEPVH